MLKNRNFVGDFGHLYLTYFFPNQIWVIKDE